jgi:hypothetical protein
MLGIPVDGIVVWAGLALVSLTALGVAADLPTSVGPDAGGVADAIDRVGASPYGATTTVPVHAAEIRLGSTAVSLRRAGSTSHATLALGSATPVGDGRLRRVLRGTPAHRVYASKADFRRALDRYPVRPIEWRPAPDELRIRRVTWGEFDATLVG